MAIFGTKKNTKKDAKAEKPVSKAVVVAEAHVEHMPKNLAHILRRPRITEKASLMAEQNVYAFEVARDATKHLIAAAVKDQYNVTPVKVAIVTIPKKNVMVRNTPGVTGGGKKAYVYLKKGETIEFV